MGELSTEAFAEWLIPSDVVNHFFQQGMGDAEAHARTLAMLCDGLLQAAAGQLIVNGEDRGLALIARELWPVAGKTQVWTTDRFRLSGQDKDGKPWSISAYDVRIDRDIRSLTPPERRASSPASDQSSKPPLPDVQLQKWGEVFRAANSEPTEADARRAIEATFPVHFVSRERLRRIMPSGRRGRPLKVKG